MSITDDYIFDDNIYRCLEIIEKVTVSEEKAQKQRDDIKRFYKKLENIEKRKQK